VRAANSELLGLYWSVGRDILDRQEQAGWGSRVIDRLATDLRAEFPDQRGWSRRNLHYMRSFAEAWPTAESFVPQAVAQLPWGHVRVLLDKLSTRQERDWYAAPASKTTPAAASTPRCSTSTTSRSTARPSPSTSAAAKSRRRDARLFGRSRGSAFRRLSVQHDVSV
jgi:hypothetical protein